MSVIFQLPEIILAVMDEKGGKRKENSLWSMNTLMSLDSFAAFITKEDKLIDLNCFSIKMDFLFKQTIIVLKFRLDAN